MKVLFIYNPFSGKALIKDHLYDIFQEFTRLNADIVVRATKGRLDAYEYILANEGVFDMIVCSGGDGTLNETVSALMRYKGEKPKLGYIPSGSTNDFARSLSIPKRMRNAAAHIVDGKPYSVDIGSFNDKFFTYVAATGAFTEVSYATPQNLKNVLGHQAYIIEGIKNLTSIKPKHMIIESDNGMYEGDFIYGMVTNARSVGGYKGITGKHVLMDDGLFEVTFIKAPTNPMQLQQIMTSLLMQDYSNDVVYYDHVDKIKITTDEPVSWVLDGEFGGDLSEVNIQVNPKAIDIIVCDKKDN